MPHPFETYTPARVRSAAHEGCLYWTAEATHEDDSYELTEMVLTNADLHVQIFDRLFCLDDRLVKTCIRLLNDVREAVHRKTLLLLRVQIRNTVIEALDGEQLEALVSNCLTLAQDEI